MTVGTKPLPLQKARSAEQSIPHAFQHGSANQHKQLPTRGGSWAEFQGRNEASRTAAHFKS